MKGWTKAQKHWLCGQKPVFIICLFPGKGELLFKNFHLSSGRSLLPHYYFISYYVVFFDVFKHIVYVHKYFLFCFRVFDEAIPLVVVKVSNNSLSYRIFVLLIVFWHTNFYVFRIDLLFLLPQDREEWQ